VTALLKLVHKENVRVDILTTGIGNAAPTTARRQPPARGRVTITPPSSFRTPALWPREYQARPGNKLTCAVSGLCYYLQWLKRGELGGSPPAPIRAPCNSMNL